MSVGAPPRGHAHHAALGGDLTVCLTLLLPPAEVAAARPRLRRAAFALAVGLALGMSSARAQGTMGDERAIREARERSNRAIAAHDTAALAAEWMESLHVTASTSQQTAGRAANVQRFAEQFASRPGLVYRRTSTKVTVYSAWGTAAETGRWTGRWSDRDGAIRIGGSYFAKWQKQDGRWRILAEIFVPDHCAGGAYCRTIPTIR